MKKPLSLSLHRTLGWPAALGCFLALSGWSEPPKTAPVPAAAPAAKIAPASALPPAREVIANYVKAVGGEQAVVKHSSHHSRAIYELPSMGLKGDMDIYAAKPNRVFVKVTLPGLGEILSGYDGKTGWSINPATGPMIMEGRQLEQTRDDYDFYAVLHSPANFKTLETVERIEFEGQPCYKVRALRKSGQEDFEYFDAKTGLQTGSVLERESPTGTIRMTNVISDYKKFADLQLPTRLVQRMLGMEQVITLSAVEFDNVKDSVFELPVAIKNLAR